MEVLWESQTIITLENVFNESLSQAVVSVFKFCEDDHSPCPTYQRSFKIENLMLFHLHILDHNSLVCFGVNTINYDEEIITLFVWGVDNQDRVCQVNIGAFSGNTTFQDITGWEQG